MKPVILRTGKTFPELRETKGEFEAWFARGLGWSVDRFAVVDGVDGDPLPDPGGIDGLFITGSAKSVHDKEPWSVRAGEWVARVMEAGIPILGVCYGHQLIGDVLGGDVGPNPNGREMGVCSVETYVDDPLFEGLPTVFPVIQTHLDAVNRAPAGATVIAGNENTYAQAMAIGANTRTIQWHPEFDHEVIEFYIRARAHLIDAEGGPGATDRMLAAVRPVDTGRTILRNFVQHYLK